jgi:hypothetical protein
MPFQTEDYNPPSLPELRQIKSFEEVRDAVSRIMQYLQHLQAADVQYFQRLRTNLNASSTTEAEQDIPSAPTIRPTRFMQVVTGTDTVTTIIRQKDFVGQLMLVSRDGFYLASGGNISLIETPNFLKPGAHIMLTWIPSLGTWVADTCRLTNSPTALVYGGRNVLIDGGITPFDGGHYIRVGNFILAALTGSTVEVNLPVPVAVGPNWGGAVFNYSGIILFDGYGQLSLEATGGTQTVKLTQSGSGVATVPVQADQLGVNAQWRGTIWYRTT